MKLIRTNNNKEYRNHFYIDQDGEIWLDSDPNGIDISGKVRIVKAPKEMFKVDYTQNTIIK